MSEPAVGVPPQPPASGGRALRGVFAAFATGVTVVTVGGAVPHGMTANSFASVSLDPPLVLICVEQGAMLLQRIPPAGAFAISVLGAGQEAVARHFADRSRPPGARQFEQVGCCVGPSTGAPLIDGAVAWIECGLWKVHPAGDHSIVIGKVRAAWHGSEQAALLFFEGRYAELSRPPSWSLS